MCIIECDSYPYKEDRSNTYLTRENGRYVPAAPIVYVPGLRQIVRKQDRRRDRDYYMNGGPPLPMHYIPGHTMGEVGGSAYWVEPPYFSTARDANHHAMLTQPTTAPYQGFGGDSVQDDALEGSSFTSDKNKNEIPIWSERSTSTSDAAANTFASSSSASTQDETSEPETSHTTNVTEESISPQLKPSRPKPERTSIRRPVSELSAAAVQSGTGAMPSARAAKQADPLRTALYGANIFIRSRPKPTAEIKPLKSILKQKAISPNTLRQTSPRRTKSVSFSLSTDEDALDDLSSEVKAKIGRTSPPPRPSSPSTQSSTSSAGRLSKEHIAAKANGGKAKSNKAGQKTANRKETASKLTKDNLTMHSQSGHGGRWMRRSWTTNDDETASNTDWDLAERMKRRWM